MTEYEQEIALIEKMGLKTNLLLFEYEKKVCELWSLPKKHMARGWSEEQIARAMHEKRREIEYRYKEADPPLFRECIYETTTAKNVNPLIPIYEIMREKKTCT